jgi:hypothetical protein
LEILAVVEGQIEDIYRELDVQMKRMANSKSMSYAARFERS